MYADRETAGGRIIGGTAGRVRTEAATGSEARYDWNPREFQQQPAALRLAQIVPAPLASEGRAAKAAIRLVPAAIPEPATARSTASAVIIDFAKARRSGHAARVGDAASNENQDSLTLTDWAVFAYALMATTFYPLLAWFFVGF